MDNSILDELIDSSHFIDNSLKKKCKEYFEQIPKGIGTWFYSSSIPPFVYQGDIIDKLDVINILRIQSERQADNLFPSLREYNEIFGVNTMRLANAKKELLIMHPGPMNRGVEISTSVADSPRAVITDQVTNGIAIRMAVFYLLAGSQSPIPSII